MLEVAVFLSDFFSGECEITPSQKSLHLAGRKTKDPRVL
jgi:hypothetical protein